VLTRATIASTEPENVNVHVSNPLSMPRKYPGIVVSLGHDIAPFHAVACHWPRKMTHFTVPLIVSPALFSVRILVPPPPSQPVKAVYPRLSKVSVLDGKANGDESRVALEGSIEQV
jgi:hypothetical protein